MRVLNGSSLETQYQPVSASLRWADNIYARDLALQNEKKRIARERDSDFNRNDQDIPMTLGF